MSIQCNKPYLRSKYSNALTRQACVSCPSACSCDLGERSVMDQLMIKKWQQGGVNIREGFGTEVESSNPNLLTLCGNTDEDACFTWDIHNKKSGFDINKCYNLDDTIGPYQLSDKLKTKSSWPPFGDAVCSFGGASRVPDGYKLETNGLEGSWPDGAASCEGAHPNYLTLESPNCPPSASPDAKNPCVPPYGFPVDNTPWGGSKGVTRESQCAFKLLCKGGSADVSKTNRWDNCETCNGNCEKWIKDNPGLCSYPNYQLNCEKTCCSS